MYKIHFELIYQKCEIIFEIMKLSTHNIMKKKVPATQFKIQK